MATPVRTSSRRVSVGRTSVKQKVTLPSTIFTRLADRRTVRSSRRGTEGVLPDSTRPPRRPTERPSDQGPQSRPTGAPRTGWPPPRKRCRRHNSGGAESAPFRKSPDGAPIPRAARNVARARRPRPPLNQPAMVQLVWGPRIGRELRLGRRDRGGLIGADVSPLQGQGLARQRLACHGCAGSCSS